MDERSFEPLPIIQPKAVRPDDRFRRSSHIHRIEAARTVRVYSIQDNELTTLDRLGTSGTVLFSTASACGGIALAMIVMKAPVSIAVAVVPAVLCAAAGAGVAVARRWLLARIKGETPQRS